MPCWPGREHVQPWGHQLWNQCSARADPSYCSYCSMAQKTIEVEPWSNGMLQLLSLVSSTWKRLSNMDSENHARICVLLSVCPLIAPITPSICQQRIFALTLLLRAQMNVHIHDSCGPRIDIGNQEIPVWARIWPLKLKAVHLRRQRLLHNRIHIVRTSSSNNRCPMRLAEKK